MSKNPDNFIEYFWIPSHSGIIGNEMADKITKEASELIQETEIILPFSDYFESYKKDRKLRTSRHIEKENTIKGIFYVQIFYN